MNFGSNLIWVIVLFMNRLETACGWFDVNLIAPSYVALGGTVRLICLHGVSKEIIHKVEWFKDGEKLFQYVNHRVPPFRGFPTQGVIISFEESSDKQVVLKNMTLQGSGFYSCDVSTNSPIFTKPSEYHQLTVLEGQRESPRISFGKPSYKVGEWLRANCTPPLASASLPAQVVWLIDGNKAADNWVKRHRGRTTELNIMIDQNHAPRIRLTCLTYLPGGQRARSSTVPVDIDLRRKEDEARGPRLAKNGQRISCKSSSSSSKFSSFFLLMTSLLSCEVSLKFV